MSNEAKNIGNAVVDRETDHSALRQLDAEIAERVMGWQRLPDYNYWMTFPSGETFKLHALIATWNPSADLERAMQVAEKMRERGYMWNAQTPHGKGWEIQCYPNHSAPKGKKFRGLLPEAICRAALHALECLSINNHGNDGPASETE